MPSTTAATSTAPYTPVLVNPDATSPPHSETHFDSAAVVRDLCVGLSDGLTVPFALSAGLSALQNPALVVTAGLAEIVAGAISMGLGGWLAGRSEINHYDAERRRELKEVREMPQAEVQEIVDIFEPYGISRDALAPLISQLQANEEQFVDFMMKFELNLERPSSRRSWISALTIGLSYLAGGLVPLIPYFFIRDNIRVALFVSAGLTVFVLLIFGFIKARVLGVKNAYASALETALIGIMAAAVAWGVATLVQEK